RVVYMELGKAEGVLPPEEQIPDEQIRVGQHLKVLLLEERKRAKGAQVIVSRAHKALVRRLLEFEIPELQSGAVVIRALAREPGVRSKVAVTANQESIDPVGACVGPRGVRIRSVVGELGSERVDIIPWADDAAQLVANALSPAQVLSVEIDKESRTATAHVPENQLSPAIGKDGQNARLPPGQAQVGPAPVGRGRWDHRRGSAPGHRTERLPVPRGGLLGPGAEAARARSRPRLPGHGPRLGAASSGNNDVSPPPGGRTQAIIAC